MQPLSDKIAEERDPNNQPLLAMLTHHYGGNAEKLPLEQVQEQALATVFERLQAHIKQERSVSHTNVQTTQERLSRRLEKPVYDLASKRPRYHLLGQIAGVFFLVVIVGSLIAVFNLTRPFGNGAYPTGPALYVTRNSTLYKLAADTGKLIWRYDMDGPPNPHASPITPLVSHGIVYLGFKQDLYAVKVSNGSLLWKKQFSERSIPVPWVAMNESLYVADGTHIYELDSARGTIRWYHNVQWAQGSVLAMQSDISGIYAILFNAHADSKYQLTSLVAFDDNTGQERWRLPMTPPQVFTSDPHINGIYGNMNKQMSILNGVVYFTTVVHIPVHTGIAVYAASTRNGAIVWHSTSVSEAQQVIPQRNIIYLIGLSYVYGFNTTNGVLLWQHMADIAINESVLVTPEKVSFLETNLQGDYVTTLNTANGSRESHQSLDDAYRFDIDTSLPPDRGGAYYTAFPRKVLMDATTTYVGVFKNDFLEAFDNQSGKIRWSYTFSDANGIGAAPMAIVEAS